MDLGAGHGSSGEDSSYSASEDDDTEMPEEDGGFLASSVNEFFSELDIEKSKQKKRLLESRFRVPRRKSILPSHLHSVMGSANLSLARGDVTGAIKLCLEVIRQAPQACESYLTLATCYEEVQDEKKLFQILLIAAHLKRTDGGLWVKCAEAAKKQNNLRVAAQCLTKALPHDPQNIQLMWERASLYCRIQETKKAIDAFEQIMEVLPSEGANADRDHMEVSKELAALYYEAKNTPKAVDILGKVLVSHPHLVDRELVNLLAELCIVSKAYEQVYEVITAFFQMLPQPTLSEDAASKDQSSLPFSLTYALRLTELGYESAASGGGEEEGEGEEPATPLQQQQQTTERSLFVPDDMPVDLRVKLALAMINLGRKLPEKLLEPIFSSPEDNGDLFLDIADAYMANTDYAKALPLLSSLVGTRTYSQAGVWLKHAECQYMQNDLEGAVMSYSRVLTLAPLHTDTRLQLATLYVQMGQADDALMVLEAEPNSEKGNAASMETNLVDFTPPSSFVSQNEGKVTESCSAKETDIRVTLQKYNLLRSTGKLKEYVKEGCSLLAYLFRDIYTHPEIKVLVRLKIKKKKAFRRVFTRDSLLSPAEWFDLFRETCVGLLKLGTDSCHYQLTYFIYCAMVTMKFSGTLEKPFIFFSVSLCFIIKDYGTALMLLRDMCYEDQHNKHLWNIVNLLPCDDFNRKFMLRLCHKHASPFIMRILANYSMTSAGINIRFCLSQFEKEFREGRGKDPLLSLCIAVVYINSASQVKNPPNRNAVVTMASGFLHTYVRLRGKCQESTYNMGRAFHQLGIPHIACHFYKKVLIMDPECKLQEWCDLSDLRSEAAFNLSLIYRNSGNLILARDMLRRYCTV